MSIASTATEVYLASAASNNQTVPPPIKNFPVCTTVASGAQAARTERVIITLSNTYGESANSVETIVQVPANNVVLVYAPGHLEGSSTPGGATGWNCYITTGAALSETKQNTSTLSLGSNFQEPASGLIGGAALPNNAITYPGLTHSNNNLANTPPSTGGITVAQSPSGTSVTSTNRTVEATQSYMAASLNILNVGTTPPPPGSLTH